MLRTKTKELLWRIRLSAPVQELRTAKLHTPPERALQRLAQRWRNADYVADVGYLCAVWRFASVAAGPVLECGSGVTTVVLLAVAERRGIDVVTLEDHPAYREEVIRRLKSVSLPVHRVRLAPLRNYGGYEWYTLPESLPARFDLVICDGPAGDTRGGRYGLMPVCGERLRGATILLDDAHRAPEAAILNRWKEQFGISHTVQRTYAILKA